MKKFEKFFFSISQFYSQIEEMERDKDEMQRLTEMLNDPNAEFQVHQELDFE